MIYLLIKINKKNVYVIVYVNVNKLFVNVDVNENINYFVNELFI
jgi:hypothetical protein